MSPCSSPNHHNYSTAHSTLCAQDTNPSLCLSVRPSVCVASMAPVSRTNLAVMVSLLVVAMALQQHAVSAQCGNVNSLVGCLGAATRGDQPTPACCNAMAAFAQYGTPAGEACLCQAINNPTAKSAGAKMQFAVQIPQKCGLNYKAGYVCNVVCNGKHGGSRRPCLK